MTKGNLLAFTALSMGITMSGAAKAQDSLGNEIIVTAQKREQNANDVGIAITAVSGEQLRDAGVRESKDILRVAPGVLLDSVSSGGFASNLTIRGIAQSDFSPTQESPNSIYIDDVYLASSSAAAFPIYDLQRVEVLRGPQGTLFGRASSGGLAHFISRGPSDYLEGFASIEYGRFNSINAEAAISGPLSNTVRARIAGRFEDADGWWINRAPGGKDTFENKFFGVRGTIEADLGDSLVATAIVSYDKKPRHYSGNYKGVVTYPDPATGRPAPLPADIDAYGTGPGNDFVGYRDPFKNAQTSEFNNVGFFENEKFSSTLKLEWDLGGADITSVSNYTNFSFNYLEDCDGGPINYCNYGLGQNLDQYSQELRATGTGADGRLVWTVGAFYLNINQDAYISFAYPSLSGSDYSFSDINNVAQKLESYAAFGQLEYDLTDKLTAILGLRYTHDKRSIDSKLYYLELGNGYFGGTGTVVYDPPLLDYDFSSATVGDLSKVSKDLWTGNFQLNYEPNPDTLLYARVARGQKGPGFNTNVAGLLSVDQTPFSTETVWAYEAGAKLGVLDGMAQFNLSAYYYDYSNFQGYTFAAFQNIVANYDGEFYGGELEFSAKPMDGLYLSLGASYLKTKLYDVPTFYSGVRDQEGVLAPEWTVNGLISKTFDVGSNKIGLQWSFDYVDDRYASIDNNYATFLKGSFVHNARITYQLSDPDIEFAVFVDNISDVDRTNFAFDLTATGGNSVFSYAKPRWWGVSARVNF